MLIGDTAGFLNVPKIKGTHTAMKSGMVAAEAVAEALAGGPEPAGLAIPQRLQASWLWDELYRVRNVRPASRNGACGAGWPMPRSTPTCLRGRAPWTLHHRSPTTQRCARRRRRRRSTIPKPDGTLTFDRLSSVFISNTTTRKTSRRTCSCAIPAVAIAVNWENYRSPETRYCPAGVYEIVGAEEGNPRLQINFANCVHCKTCDIKDPTQNIDWVTPEGGGGPAYPGGM